MHKTLEIVLSWQRLGKQIPLAIPLTNVHATNSLD